MKLAETQALFFRLVTRASGVGRDEAERCFLGSPQMPVAERIEVYSNMYLWRLVDALREEFPKLAAAMGDEGFYELCESYVRAYPSEHPDLRHLGRHLAQHLRDQDWGRSDFSDLATLEWARSEVFFEAPATSASASVLASLGEQFANARLKLIPALRLLRLRHDVVEVWRCLEDSRTVSPPSVRPTAVAVWRRDFDVFHTPLELDESLALERAMASRPLAEVCAAFEGRSAPAEAAFAALGSWLAEGWVEAVSAADADGCAH
ncbi:MAG: putative DNA-binding domain-containing protein [Myxococcota bacterium]